MQVPATNTTRFEFSENGPINVPEQGSVTTESGLRDLLITDCYQRVHDRVRYPAVLVTAGLNDPRLAIRQPAKMAARLQAATASGRPVLLRIDPHAGHGYGSTRVKRNEFTADIPAFLLQELTHGGLGGRRGCRRWSRVRILTTHNVDSLSHQQGSHCQGGTRTSRLSAYACSRPGGTASFRTHSR
jgi:Prolyl oligopeptidase family